MPTPQEIAEACRRIREGWDEQTYRDRAGVPRQKSRVELQVVSAEAMGTSSTPTRPDDGPAANG